MGNSSDRPDAAERRRRFRRGHLSEWLAATFLMAKGYRILARRWASPLGEVDLIAVRGGRLAFVEVKRRLTFEDAEASITPRQRQRIRRAADLWLARRPRYQTHEIGFDLVFLAPRRWPRHIENGL
jgi:putative endonuclease